MIQYIVLIVSGGIFGFLLLLYGVLAIEKDKLNKRNNEKLSDSYKEKNLRKMEYDIAFYDGKHSRRENVSQVAMDDLLSDGKASEEAQLSENAVFAQIEYEGIKEIKGNYNPESAN